MAWTERLSSGRYRGCYRDRKNEKRYVRGTFVQEAEALRKAGAKQDEQRRPGAIDERAGKITWGRWFEEWMEFHAVSAKTEREYRRTVTLHVMPYWEDTPLNDIDMIEGMKWVKRLQRDPVPEVEGAPHRRGRGKPRSPHTVRSAVQILTASLNAAVTAKRLGVNPVKGLSWPALPPGRDRYLTRAEVEAIAHFMNLPINRLILWTAVTCGLRAGELGGLHTSRLDLDRGLIQVTETLDQEVVTINAVPKDKEQRWVPIPPEVVDLLKPHVAALPKPKTCGIEHNTGRCPGGALVFRGIHGGPFRSNPWARGPFGRAMGLAKIEGRVRVHDLRHTYASWLIQSGATLAEVAEVMGHSDTEVTKRYAHLRRDNFTAVRAALKRHAEHGAEHGAEVRLAALSDATPSEQEYAV